MKAGRSLLPWTVCATLLLAAGPAQAQQDLGHKVLGSLGLQAGSQERPGVYVVDRVLFYGANHLVDRNGNRIPVNVDIDAFANGLGIAGIVRLAPFSTYLGASIGMPVTRVRLNTDRPEASLDRFGLGDLFVQPVKLGWRMPQFHVVAGYAFYAPTGRFEPGGRSGVGRGFWTHEPSLGGTAFFDRAKTWNLSVLASYDFNQRKRGIDITRGNTIQMQGGAGKTLFRILEVGLAGYAEWQVRDDRGADLPDVIRGARDRAFGLGPEVVVQLPPVRSKLSVRYEHDFGARSRPVGQILVVGLAFAAWLPPEPPAGRPSTDLFP